MERSKIPENNIQQAKQAIKTKQAIPKKKFKRMVADSQLVV